MPSAYKCGASSNVNKPPATVTKRAQFPPHPFALRQSHVPYLFSLVFLLVLHVYSMPLPGVVIVKLHASPLSQLQYHVDGSLHVFPPDWQSMASIPLK